MRLSLVHVAVALAALATLLIAVSGCEERRSAGVVRADWRRTPGALNPTVTQATIGQTICVRGWTRTIRPPTSYTNELKARHLREYGLNGRLTDFQEDHLISLELGGHPTDPRNLWPEPYPRARDVDQIENELHEKVCNGELTLAEAQRRESELKHRDG